MDECVYACIVYVWVYECHYVCVCAYACDGFNCVYVHGCVGQHISSVCGCVPACLCYPGWGWGACMPALLCVGMYACVNVWRAVCITVWVSAFLYARMYVWVGGCWCVCACVCICMCVHLDVWIGVPLYMWYKHVHVYVCVCMYI